MYLEYWNLKEKPFDNTPDRRFLYPSDNHRDALQKILWTVTSEKGCSMLSGEYGCGKTILIRTIVNRLDTANFRVALINYPVFDRESFLQEILFQFGQSSGTEGRDRSSLFREISQYFYQNVSENMKSILIIDEAQLIDDDNVFEELRLLLNMQLEDRFLINVLLVGQPELREKVMTYPQLDQQIAVKCHLHRFDHEDTAGYIKHRLHIAGQEKPLFDDESLYLIHKLSNGVPRRINNVADLCLLEGSRRKADIIDGEIFRYIV